MAEPLIALLTDFGTPDGYVGVMKGVILGIAPHVRLVDLTHDIAPQDVREAAWVLHTAWRYFPDGAIFLCVIDPGVGSARAAMALSAGGRYFVGPDNGLFTYIYQAEPGAHAVALDRPEYHLPHPSATFHGRDIFAPGAAHLARGVPLEELGSPLSTERLMRFAIPEPERHAAGITAHIVHVDHFGNLITDLDADLTASILASPRSALHVAGTIISARASTFAAGPDHRPFMLRDSSGHLAIAVRNGSAVSTLGVSVSDSIEVSGLATSG
jgi:S-adenosylmethionine hydrolase